MRCGKYVSPACTLDLAPVQVHNTLGVFHNRESLGGRRSASVKGDLDGRPQSDPCFVHRHADSRVRGQRDAALRVGILAAE